MGFQIVFIIPCGRHGTKFWPTKSFLKSRYGPLLKKLDAPGVKQLEPAVKYAFVALEIF